MDLSNCMRTETSVVGNIKSCILHHRLTLSEVYVHPAVAGLEEKMASYQVFTLGKLNTHKRLVGDASIISFLFEDSTVVCGEIVFFLGFLQIPDLF